MELTEILDEFQARGLRATVRAGVLMIGPGNLMSDALREAVKENMADLLAHYSVSGDEQIRWRVARMLEQLLVLSWPCPVPCLFARREAEPGKQDCKSCGELLDAGKGDSFCCGLCARAKTLALELWMARPAQSVRAA